MGRAETFIAVDWGTTNRRAYLIVADGSVGAEVEDDKGILSVATGGFPAAVAELRERLGSHPMLLAGMVGSNRGWIEAPYVPTPAGAEELARALTRVEAAQAWIVPGVSHVSGDAADVMRGEEIQIIGATAAGSIPPDCLMCHPGTHNKWVSVRDGRIAAFRTVMTGELFSLLKKHSILSDLLSSPVDTGAAFEAGVNHGLRHGDLTAELFSVRARVLLGKAERLAAASYASGLLIGRDVAVGLALSGEGEVVAMGRPELTRLYSEALGIAGRAVRQVDGERVFVAGAIRIAELMP